MTTLYYPPKFDSGLAGAKLTFSITGTTTLQNTYTNEALTVASSNPVVADANGVFAPIYLDPKLPSYRVKFTTAADVLIYQVDNVPSNQNIQQSVRLEATNPFLFLYDTDGTTNARKYRIRAAGNSFQVQASNDAESVFTTILEFVGGVLYSGGTEVAVTETGNFTGTLTGCTTSPTGHFIWRKLNEIVTLWTTTGATGTSNTTAMTITGLPVGIRPQFTTVVPCSKLFDNGTLVEGTAAVGTGGAVTFAVHTVSGSQIVSGAFTNSGTKGVDTAWCITYPIV